MSERARALVDTYQHEEALSVDACSSLNAVGSYRNAFTYDPTGNWLVKNESGSITTSTFDVANQLATNLSDAGVTTYTFDADGNQVLTIAPNGDRTTTTLAGVADAPNCRPHPRIIGKCSTCRPATHRKVCAAFESFCGGIAADHAVQTGRSTLSPAPACRQNSPTG